MATGTATDFQKMISDGSLSQLSGHLFIGFADKQGFKIARERRRNEALADKIFCCPRKEGKPSKLKRTLGDSLASRTGVSKKRAFPSSRRSSAQAFNLDANLNHDIHDAIIDQPDDYPSARMTLSGSDATTAKKGQPPQRMQRLKIAMENMVTDQFQKSSSPRARAAGLTIRGLAGPFCVVGQNFAPGTSEADIESAMKPVGGEMISCRIVETNPLVTAEIVFTAREGGERVIETFHNKTADGRILKVYAKRAGPQLSIALNRPRVTRNLAQDQIVDGYMGFPEDSTVTNSYANSNSPLYSDNIFSPNRQGRKFRRAG